MKLPNEAHTSRPWRIHEIAPDFRLEDVWALPTPGGPHDLPQLAHAIAAADLSQTSSPIARTLFTVRNLLGARLGLDDPAGGVGSRVATLRTRLPADLADSPAGPTFATLPFTSLYLLDDEWAAETANRTMHGVLHLGWVQDDDVPGGWRGQLAILVKPNGVLGNVYMAAIKPFRYLFVYPAVIRQIGRRWQEATTTTPNTT